MTAFDDLIEALQMTGTPFNAEVASRITELQQALAERDATIAAARNVASEMSHDPEYPLELLWRTRIMDVLSAAPGDALRAHDAEVQAQALEVAATEYGSALTRSWLKHRAKAIREQEGE